MKVQVKIKKKKSQTVIGSLQENSGEFCYCFIEVGSSILSDDIKLRKKKEHAFFEVNDGYQNNYPPVVPTSSSWRQ